MDLLTCLAPAAVVIVFVITAHLARRTGGFSAQDDFGAANPVAPAVMRNSAIAYGSGLTALAPLFAWAADGRLGAALLYAACAGCGLTLVALLRRPVRKLLDGARRGGAVTIHEFVCRRHGGDPRVKALAAALTLGAVAGLLACEMLAAATVLEPLLGAGTPAAPAVVAVLVVVTVCVAGSGSRGAMHAGQMLLGIMYLGLFGATALLLYLQMSELGSVPARGRLAIAVLALLSAVLFACRRVRWVDTAPIVPPGDAGRPPAAARALRRFGKILNVLVAVFVGVVIGFCAVELYVAGIAAVFDDAAALMAGADLAGTPLADPRVPAAAVAVFVLRALVAPLVDAGHWHRVAAFERQRDGVVIPERRWRRMFRGVFAGGAAEAAAVVALLFLFATLATLNPGAAPEPEQNVLWAVVADLAAQDNFVAATAVPLLLLALCAMAVATMGSLLAAGLATVRDDVVAMVVPKASPAVASGTMLAAAAGLGAAAAALFLAGARYGLTWSSGGFLALVLGSSCLQLSLAPLVLGAVVTGSGRGALAPRSALAVMAAGAVTGTGAVAAFLATGYQPLLWAALPGCLGAGSLLFAVAVRRAGNKVIATPAAPAGPSRRGL